MAGGMGSWLEYGIIRGIVAGISSLPYESGLKWGSGIGRSLSNVMARHRKVAAFNIRQAFPDWTSEARHELLLRHFEHLGKFGVEFMWLSRREDVVRRRVRVVGLQHHDEAKKNGKGVVMIVPHYGNWEIVGAMYPTFARQLVTIAFPQTNPYVNGWVDRVRTRWGIKIIPTGMAIRGVLKALHEGNSVGFLADQDAGMGGVFVKLFGRLAATAKGPVAFALKTGAPLLMTVIHRDPDNTHVLEILPEIPIEKKSTDEETIAWNTQKWSSLLEERIRRDPAQWFWVHRRWKTQPHGVPYPYEGI